MLKVAITGSIATGKSLIEGFIRDDGFSILDTDRVVHHLLKENETVISKIKTAFGDEAFEGDEISRVNLGKIVFYDSEKKKLLESILHPCVKQEIFHFLMSHRRERVVFVSVPLLYEVGWQGLFDYVLVVYAEADVQLKRLMDRNLIDENAARNLVSLQMHQSDKVKAADFVLDNSTTIDSAKRQFDYILKKLLMLT